MYFATLHQAGFSRLLETKKQDDDVVENQFTAEFKGEVIQRFDVGV